MKHILICNRAPWTLSLVMPKISAIGQVRVMEPRHFSILSQKMLWLETSMSVDRLALLIHHKPLKLFSHKLLAHLRPLISEQLLAMLSKRFRQRQQLSPFLKLAKFQSNSSSLLKYPRKSLKPKASSRNQVIFYSSEHAWMNSLPKWTLFRRKTWKHHPTTSRPYLMAFSFSFGFFRQIARP